MIGDAVAKAADDAVERVTGTFEAAGLRVAFFLAAALSIVGAITTCAVAAYLWLLPMLGPAASALCVAGGFVLLAGVLYALARWYAQPPTQPEIEPVEVVEDEVEETVRTLGPVQFVIVAAGVGALLALSFGSRDKDSSSSSPSLFGLIGPLASLYSTIVAQNQSGAQTSPPAAATAPDPPIANTNMAAAE
jgi:hypothetical protein